MYSPSESSDHWDEGDSCSEAWAEGVIRSVNWMAGVGLVAPKKTLTGEQGVLLQELRHSFDLLELWKQTDVSNLHPVSLLTRSR